MPHYVNIAWGVIFWRGFLFVRLGSSLLFVFTAMELFYAKIKKQCAASGWIQKA
jgi:hypothetical protein